MSVAHVRYDRVCELDGRLKAFTPLFWWLEYWGDWAAAGSTGSMNVLQALIRLKEDGFIDRSTAMDGYPDDIAVLERSLARLRIANRFQFSVLTQIHIGKACFREVASSYAIRRRGLERTLWYAYSAVDAAFQENDPVLWARQAPVYCRT